jgi:hypothetical protein
MRRLNRWLAAGCALVSLGTLASCGRLSQRDVQPHIEAPVPRTLSAWHLFTSHSPALQPNRGVTPYDLNTPLFSDYSDKFRFVWMPPGTSARYADDGPFEFPVGTVLAKTFAFPIAVRSAGGQSTDGHAQAMDRLIETRLLVHAKTGWVGLPLRVG